jgi:competence protein ComEA
MPCRLAILALFSCVLLPSWVRSIASRPAPPRSCAPVGLGVAPEGWVGCAGDPGPRRDLTGRERLLVGLPVDVNAAVPDDLAAVPGFTARLASEVVAERERGGRYCEVADLLRVRGIGPARLERARPYLIAER